MVSDRDANPGTRVGDSARTVERVPEETRKRRRSGQDHIDQSAQRLARGVDRDGLAECGRGVEIELVHQEGVISAWSAPDISRDRSSCGLKASSPALVGSNHDASLLRTTLTVM
jgi:hypothetical protein